MAAGRREREFQQHWYSGGVGELEKGRALTREMGRTLERNRPLLQQAMANAAVVTPNRANATAARAVGCCIPIYTMAHPHAHTHTRARESSA